MWWFNNICTITYKARNDTGLGSFYAFDFFVDFLPAGDSSAVRFIVAASTSITSTLALQIHGLQN